MSGDLVIQHPAGTPRGLVLLFHGVGAQARDMAGLGRAVAQARPDAQVVSVAAPWAADFGPGRQWFSVRGITEENRATRIASAMPEFVRCVLQHQQDAGVTADDTVLIGFSQGAIMALESARLQPAVAHVVIAIAGRFADPATLGALPEQVHLLHGIDDPVIPARWSELAHQRLQQSGSATSLALWPALGHAMDDRIIDHVVQLAQPQPVRR